MVGAVGTILILLASGLVITGMYQVGASLWRSGEFLNQRLLTAVGYVVIAIAVFDVAKYLLEEEVVRERELRQVGEVRRSLTRFTSTILIAVLLEAIVLIFKVAEDDISLTIYPTLLVVAGVAMLIGLGAFQRLAATAEHATGEHDDADDKPPARNGKGKIRLNPALLLSISLPIQWPEMPAPLQPCEQCQRRQRNHGCGDEEQRPSDRVHQEAAA